MITTTLSAFNLCKSQVIALGRQLENNYRQIVFDCSDFSEEITAITLVHQRKDDIAPYIVATSTGDTLTWTITDTDTAYYGYGKGELRITFDSGLAKSIVFTTMVVKSITADTTIPTALQSWYDAMIQYIDDNSVSQAELEQAIADYITAHPVTFPVDSVNGQTGTVVLSASDVGALDDSTVIPTKTSQLTNDSGFITDAGVTSFNGNTGAVTYTAPVTSVNGNTGAVSLEIPSNASDITNDSAVTGTNVDDALNTLNTQIDDLYTESSNIFDPANETKVIAINSSGKCLFYVDASTAYRGVIFDFTSTKSIGYKFTYAGSGISSVKLASYAQKPTSNSDAFVALRQITGTKYNNDYVGLLPHDEGAAYYVFDIAFSSGASYDTIFATIRANLYIFESDETAYQDVDWDNIHFVPHEILNVPMDAIPEELLEEVNNKVDKIAGKGLSQNDFTDATLQKLNDCYSEIFGESEIIVQYGDEGITSGSWASTNDGAIKTTVNTRLYDVTDFIPCSYGDMLYLCEVQSICFYDSSKAFLAGGGVTISNIDGYTGNGLQNNYTISNADAAYMRINFYNANYSSQMVNGMYAACRRTSAPYEIVNLGDSIFGLNPKPYDVSTHIQNAVMRKTANCGFGGTRASVHTLSDYVNFSLFNLADAIATNDYSLQDGSDFSTLGSGYYYRYNLATLKSIDFSKVSVLTIAYGTNDWNAAIPLENISDLDDTSTFKGALRYAIEKIQTAYPCIMIVMLAPIYRTFNSHTVDSNTKTNSGGKTLLDYVDAVKEVAAEYELPFVDNYHSSGINIFNSTTFLRDETHLTFVDGATRIGTNTGKKLQMYLK